MTASNVEAIGNATNKTIDDAIAWLNMMGERGVFPDNSARFRITALRKFCEILGAEEPREAQWMLDNIDQVADRWSTKKNAKSETAATYKTRAKGGLEDYLTYLKAPQHFKPRRRDVATKDSTTKTAKATPKAKASTPTPAQTPPPAQTPAAPMRTFTVTEGDFVFQLPAKGVSVADVHKIAYHLWTLAKDFNPTNSAQRGGFALTKAGE